ncbi:hypothetical protein LCGC14_1860570 [marine sediment metagenome]|uniref:Uncharacterized protein n=1 Tax=marine sediment metagenome TaxID=412755 RepID=A0A0F9J6R0_9ZZZZ
MKENEQTDKINEKGTEDNKPLAPDKPISLIDEARAIRDEIRTSRDELKAEKEELIKIKSDALLSGTVGGRVEPKLVSEKDKKIEGALEFFKGSQLETDIKKANEM